jgi:SagB-type dehydrogenase family enzyme
VARASHCSDGTMKNASTVAVLALAAAAAVGCRRDPPATVGLSETPLGAPRTAGSMSLEEVLQKRRSVRDFAPRDLTLDQVSRLAWAAQGVTSEKGLRTAPSAGALYPLELYLVNADGVFHYRPSGHRLERVASGDRRKALSAAALDQGAVRAAAADFVLTGVVARTEEKYGARAVRYVLLEGGHAAQNVLLEATALGLGAVPIGAIDDDAVRRALELPAEEAPLYVLAVGYPR